MAERRKNDPKMRSDRFSWKEGEAKIFKTEDEARAWLRGESAKTKKSSGSTAKKKK